MKESNVPRLGLPCIDACMHNLLSQPCTRNQRYPARGGAGNHLLPRNDAYWGLHPVRAQHYNMLGACQHTCKTTHMHVYISI